MQRQKNRKHGLLQNTFNLIENKSQITFDMILSLIISSGRRSVRVSARAKTSLFLGENMDGAINERER